MNNDLISREALRKAFHERIWYFDKSSWDEANAIIDNAPTVENITVFAESPDEKSIADLKEELQKVIAEKRPKDEWGKWIKMSDRYGVYFACEKCGYDREGAITNFCPNCGADMRKGGAE